MPISSQNGVVLSDKFQSILTKIGKRRSNAVEEESEFDRASNQFENFRASAQSKISSHTKIKFMTQQE